MPVSEELDKAVKEVASICRAKADELYGEMNFAADFLESELYMLEKTETAFHFLILKEIADLSQEKGYPILIEGNLSASVIAYLLGISDVNPLKSHYRCESKECLSRFELIKSKTFGIDADDKVCRHCDRKMVKDGFNLNPSMAWGSLNKPNKPDFSVEIASEIRVFIHSRLNKKYGYVKTNDEMYYRISLPDSSFCKKIGDMYKSSGIKPETKQYTNEIYLKVLRNISEDIREEAEMFETTDVKGYERAVAFADELKNIEECNFYTLCRILAYRHGSFKNGSIRFIAVNDMVDSDEGENEIAPFKNVMNEMYARDISRKVRSAHRIRGNMGEPLSQPPYGYMKSPENKKKWIIDTEAAEVVRDIYRMCLDGMGNEAIARELQNRQVLIPMAYWQSKGLNRGGKKTQPNPYKWCKTTVQKILCQQEYCGDVINFKTYSKNFKNKTRIDNPVENWKIFKDFHEPIIDRDTWETVQKLTARTKRRAPKKENARKHIFSGLIRCADCGSNMSYHTNTVNKDIHYFSCSNYVKDTRGTCQTRHYIRADALEQIVILELKRLAIMLQQDEDLLVDILEKRTNKDFYDEKKHLEEQLQKAIVRQQTVASLYEKLYEDNATGKVTDEWFTHMSHKYEVERAELKIKIFNLREQVANMQTVQHSKDMFIGTIRKFLDMETITAPLIHELIDHIDVYEAEGKGKNKTQRVVIHYNFVGYLEIPENDEPCFTADTRQGVAIGYIAKPTEKSA